MARGPGPFGDELLGTWASRDSDARELSLPVECEGFGARLVEFTC